MAPVIALAHSGRTDANGCHTNKKTSEYHCHNELTVKKARTEARSIARQNLSVNVEDKYICNANFYNCKDFVSQSQAQDVFEFCGGKISDIHDLDRDNDGFACEALE